MAEPTATADPANTTGNSIEDELGELDAILAEVNANTEQSAGGSKQQTSAETETETASTEEGQSDEAVVAETGPAEEDAGSPQGSTGEASIEDAAEAPAGEDQDDAVADPSAKETAEPETQAGGEQDVTDAAEDEPDGTAPDAEGSPAPAPPKTALACAARGLLWPLVAGLTILDKPFANVSLKTKSVLGYVAIATTITVVVTWVLAGFIRLQ